MGCGKRIKEIIKSCDFFSARVGLRYNEDVDYKTFYGGFVTVTLILVFFGVFTDTLLDTINKTEIYSTETYYEEINPTYFQVGVNEFMFAVGILGVDLNEGERWFDVQMTYRSLTSTERNKTTIPLYPCQRSHWTELNQTFGQFYDRLSLHQWLCPPYHMEVVLEGKFTSESFRYYKIAVKECDPDLDLSRPCVNESVIDDYLHEEETFSFSFYFINKIINGDSHEYLTNYIEDMNYLSFSPEAGVSGNIFISSYKIETDEQVLPMKSTKTDVGGVIKNFVQIHNYHVEKDEYVKFYLRKSSQSIIVQRSFKKIDDTISYIGGLFSALLTVFLFINIYTELSFEWEMANNTFSLDKQENFDPELSIFTYFGYIFYSVIKGIGCNVTWTKMDNFNLAVEELRKQIDVGLLIKKINFSEQVSTILLDDVKIKFLHLQQPLKIDQAEKIRQNYELLDNWEQFLQKKKSGSEDMLATLEGFRRQKVFQGPESGSQMKKNEISQEEKMLNELKYDFLTLEKQIREGDEVSVKIYERISHVIEELCSENKIRRPRKKGKNKTSFIRVEMNKSNSRQQL